MVWRVFDCVRREERVPEDLMVPDLIGGSPPLTVSDCRAAVEYLRRIGCMDKVDGQFVVDEIVGRLFPSQ